MMALAREASGLFEILMEEKSLRLVLDGDEHAQVEGDGLFLRQALVNILHNAVKYSPVGEAITMRVRNGDANQVTVEIQDNGPGLSTSGASTNGLGLRLVRQRVEQEAHGSIRLETSARGTRAIVELP